jgi:hypothetical protein
MAIEGESTRSIARILNRDGIPSPRGISWKTATIRLMIRDRTYKGEVRARQFMMVEGRSASGHARHKPRPEDQHIPLADARTEALVDETTWAAANKAITENIKKRGRIPKDKDHLLAGYLWCGACGGRMSPTSTVCQPRGKKYRVYRYRCNDCGVCLGAQWIDAKAWEWIEENLAEPGYLLAEYEKTRVAQPASDAIRRDLTETEHRRAQCARSVCRLIDEQAKVRSKTVKALLDEKMAQLDERMEELDLQVEDLKERLAAAEDDGTAERLRLAVEITAERLARGVFTFEERRDFIKALGFGFSASRDATRERHLRVVPEVTRTRRSGTRRPTRSSPRRARAPSS